MAEISKAGDIPSMNQERSKEPLYIIALAITTIIAAIFVLQVPLQQDVYPVDRFFLGFDYYDFYQASMNLRHGKSPYNVEKYVTPPIPAIINLPATFFPFQYVRYIVLVGLFISVALGLFLFVRDLAPPQPAEAKYHVLLYFIIMAFSYPFAFLLDRGNIDGFVLLLLSCGIYFTTRVQWLAAGLFALAISMKVYPVLVIFPIVAARKWRLLLFTIIAVLILILAAPGYWYEFVTERLLRRISTFRRIENASILCTFYHVGMVCEQLFNRWITIPFVTIFMRLAMFMYGILLLSSFALDARDTFLQRPQKFGIKATMYLPFMVAMPQLAYHYELVCLLALIPVLCWYWNRCSTPAQRTVVIGTSIGIVTSQFPAVTMTTLTQRGLWHFVPGLGLFIVLIGVVALRIAWWSSLQVELLESERLRGLS
jgi:hypothetical protein